MTLEQISPSIALGLTAFFSLLATIFLAIRLNKNYYDRLLFFVVAAPILFCGIFFLPALTIFIISQKNCEEKKVVQIGACNRFAVCSARFEDGTSGFAKHPLIGSDSKVNCKTVWNN